LIASLSLGAVVVFARLRCSLLAINSNSTPSLSTYWP
jgi:hypothetical protein